MHLELPPNLTHIGIMEEDNETKAPKIETENTSIDAAKGDYWNIRKKIEAAAQSQDDKELETLITMYPNVASQMRREIENKMRKMSIRNGKR